MGILSEISNAEALSKASSALRAGIDAEQAPGTRRAYKSALGIWSQWASERGVQEFPAQPDDVAEFLADRHAAGRSSSSLDLSVSALRWAHWRTGKADPTKHPRVHAALRGFRRLDGQRRQGPPRQARGLTTEVLAALRKSRPKRRRLPLGGFETPDQTLRRWAFDVTLAHVMSDAALRRSEAAALRWADITRMPDGRGRLLVRRSKTDTGGKGQVVALTALTICLLGRYASLCGARKDGLVFGLSGAQLARRLARACREAGLGDGFGGHSGRVGLAQRMVAQGAPTETIQLQGRWKAASMIVKYARHGNTGLALRWLE